ncbi:XdhC family protein [Frondihabitans cladoniiphilus]|uniref:XdhC family protein n=1 Tax=Frondihabitans cladoniiphilus TaxID=715785 RepID=A0ABP8VQY2_9MICO
MFEIADRLLARLDAGETVALATAVSVVGSAPRTVGTSMAVMADGTVVGSISGGCVEGAVYEACLEAFETGRASLAGYGFSDEDAFAVGLSCGGRIEVLVTLVTPQSPVVVPALRQASAGRATEVSSILEGPRLGETVARPDDCDASRSFTEKSMPPPRMLVFGATEYAVALTNAAATMGYRVTVCDARPVFLTPERFPSAEAVVVEWPPRFLARTDVDERTVIAILSHDDRYDTDLVELALASGAGYVGAMGSRTTHARRVDELRMRKIAGVDRLHSPIGLDLGASTPEETAVSILAEVLVSRSGASASKLRETDGAIHRPAPVAPLPR